MKGKRIVNIRNRLVMRGVEAQGRAVNLIHDALLQCGVQKKLAMKAELLAEETIVQFVSHAPANTPLQVQVRRLTGDTSIVLSMPGEEFDPYTGITSDGAAPDETQSEEAIRAILLRSHGEKYKYSHAKGVNRVRILAGQSVRSVSSGTLIALIAGLLFGLLLKNVLPAGAADALCYHLLKPVQTVFMNAMKIVIAPVVFFSLVTCVSQFKNISELGKLGAKILCVYLSTTAAAILLGNGIFAVFQPGEWGFALSGGVQTAAAAAENAAVDTSIRTMLINIVPSNFLAPFLESNTLQLIFLAILCGAAMGMIGEYSSVLKQLFDALNSLFLTVTTIIARFIPAAVFASVSIMVLDLSGTSFLSLIGVTGVQIFAIFLMICFYGLMILSVGRLNPLTFFRKSREGMLTSFTLSSSSAAMPTNMRVCTEKLGVSPAVANFSIPLGTTINMDGSCIYLTILSLFLARAYGVEVSVQAVLSLAVTIMLLSLGAPGVPGSGLICLGVALSVIHVPVEAIGLIIAINPLLDMFDTMSNTTGDLAAAVIVAKSEKLIDERVYKQR